MLWPVHVQKVPQALEHFCPAKQQTRGRYHGGRRPSNEDSFHSPTVIPPSSLDKPSIMKRYHRRGTTRWGVTARSPTIVTLRDTRFIECRWWNDGWTVVTWRSSASMIPAPDVMSAVLASLSARSFPQTPVLCLHDLTGNIPDYKARTRPVHGLAWDTWAHDGSIDHYNVYLHSLAPKLCRFQRRRMYPLSICRPRRHGVTLDQWF